MVHLKPADKLGTAADRVRGLGWWWAVSASAQRQEFVMKGQRSRGFWRGRMAQGRPTGMTSTHVYGQNILYLNIAFLCVGWGHIGDGLSIVACLSSGPALVGGHLQAPGDRLATRGSEWYKVAEHGGQVASHGQGT